MEAEQETTVFKVWPRHLEAEVRALEGLMKGVAFDGRVTPQEVAALRQWCEKNRFLTSRHPFDEILPAIDAALDDGVIDQEERADLIWLCQRFSTPNVYLSSVRDELQRLKGTLGGIAVDGVVNSSEIEALDHWVACHRRLRGYWPFDEVDALLQGVLADGVVSPAEHRVLLSFCSEFVSYAAESHTQAVPPEQLMSSVICAADPHIVFTYKELCFAGAFRRGTVSELTALVRQLGGSVADQISSMVSYLVIGGSANVCWALSGIGRKVEEALELRRAGVPLQIVKEADFWDAVARAR